MYCTGFILQFVFHVSVNWCKWVEIIHTESLVNEFLGVCPGRQDYTFLVLLLTSWAGHDRKT